MTDVFKFSASLAEICFINKTYTTNCYEDIKYLHEVEMLCYLNNSMLQIK